MDLEARASSSNDVLSETGHLATRRLLKEGEEYIKPLDKEIARAHPNSNALRERRADGLSRIERLRIGIASHKKVPAEILANIFTYCLDHPLRLPPIRYQTIWKVMAVCSRWRQIALAEPRIWSNLRADNERDAKYLNELLHDIFPNRGGQGMVRYQAPLISSAETWDDVVKLISAYPSRFRHLRLEFKNFFPPPPTHPPIKLEHLRSIYFSFSWENKYNSVAIPATDFFTSQSLQDITLVTHHLPPPSAWSNRILLPWAQLIDFTVREVSISTIRPAISQCTRLVNLVINLKEELGSLVLSCPLIQLTRLQSLSFLTGSDYLSVQSFLDILVAPELQSLSCEGQNWVNWPQTSVLQMIHRSGCALKRLTIPDLILEDEEVLQLMRAMPQLTEFFGSTKGYISTSTIRKLRTENLSPMLKTLDGIRVQALYPLIELVHHSRRVASTSREGSGIQYIVVGVPENHPSVEKDYYKRELKTLRDCGVHISVYIEEP